MKKYMAEDVINLFNIFKPPTSLSPNGSIKRWVLCKGEWKPKGKKKKL